MKFSRLLSAFYFEPWNLRPDLHSSFGRLLQSHIAGAPLAAQLQAPRPNALGLCSPGQAIVGPVDYEGSPIVPQMVSSGGVAVIPIYGVLGKRLDLMELACGAVDYDYLTEFATMAALDPQIKFVVLDIDSPGGSCRGLPECFDAFARLGAQKKLIAYSQGVVCSAAYYLACAAAEVYASPSASVGNIGTVLAACDDSREWEMKGWKLELFASGALKGLGVDGNAWTAEQRDFFQGWMLKKFAEFKAVVNATRPQVSQECFDGRWLDGDIAPAFGLTDGVVMDLQTVVSALMALGFPR